MNFHHNGCSRQCTSKGSTIFTILQFLQNNPVLFIIKDKTNFDMQYKLKQILLNMVEMSVLKMLRKIKERNCSLHALDKGNPNPKITIIREEHLACDIISKARGI